MDLKVMILDDITKKMGFGKEEKMSELQNTLKLGGLLNERNITGHGEQLTARQDGNEEMWHTESHIRQMHPGGRENLCLLLLLARGTTGVGLPRTVFYYTCGPVELFITPPFSLISEVVY